MKRAVLGAGASTYLGISATVSELAAPFFSIDIATGVSQESPNLGCFLDVIPMERLAWTSMLFPGYRPAVLDDIPITAIVTMEAVGTGTRYVFTALHRDEAAAPPPLPNPGQQQQLSLERGARPT